MSRQLSRSPRLAIAFHHELGRLRSGEDREYNRWPGGWKRQWAACLVVVAAEGRILAAADEGELDWLAETITERAA